jgi:hypothetical protein
MSATLILCVSYAGRGLPVSARRKSRNCYRYGKIGNGQREVKELASAHLSDLQARIAELQTIAHALTQLIAHCHGDERPQCPILDNLAGDDSAPRGELR